MHNDVVTVTYSSISTNSFQPYGECVMGSKGTLITELEQRAMLFGDGPRSTLVSVSASAGKAAMSTSGSAPPDDRRAQEVQASVGPLPSRGYREEMEHFASSFAIASAIRNGRITSIAMTAAAIRNSRCTATAGPPWPTPSWP